MAPAYWMLIHPPTVRVWANKVTEPIKPQGNTSAQACTDLGAKATQLRGLAEGRQRSQVLLGTVRGVTPPPGSERTSGGADGWRTWGHERETQSAWWDLIADARDFGRACNGLATDNGRRQAASQTGTAGNFSDSEHENTAFIESLVAQLKAAMDYAATLPLPTATISGQVSPGETRSNFGQGGLAASPTLPHVIDWCDQWVYGVGPVVTASASADSAGEPFRAAANLARSNLLEGLLGLHVDPSHALRDLATANPGLRRGMLRLVNAGEIAARRAPNGDLLWVEARLPLSGSSGLMPLILPFSGLASSLPQPDSARPESVPPADPSYSGILIDARDLAIEPSLFPRLVTPTGHTIQVPALADPNRVAQRGYTTYTPFAGQARILAGGSALWIRPTAVVRAPGEIVLRETDAERVTGARIDSPRLSPALIILTD